jgi:hypothetical protein
MFAESSVGAGHGEPWGIALVPGLPIRPTCAAGRSVARIGPGHSSRGVPVRRLTVSVRPAKRLTGTLSEEQRSGAVQPAAPSQSLGRPSGCLGFYSKQLAFPGPPVSGWIKPLLSTCVLARLACLRRQGAGDLNGHRARMNTVESNLAKAGLVGNSCQRAACPFTAPSGRARQE